MFTNNTKQNKTKTAELESKIISKEQEANTAKTIINNKSLEEEEDECSTTAGSGKSTGRKNSKVYKRLSDICYVLNTQEKQGNLLFNSIDDSKYKYNI
jgi:hypothetical protein